MSLLLRFDAFSIARVTVTISWKPRVSTREKNRRDQASKVSRADGLGLKCFTAFLMVIRAVYGGMYARLSGAHGFSMYCFQVRATQVYAASTERRATNDVFHTVSPRLIAIVWKERDTPWLH